MARIWIAVGALSALLGVVVASLYMHGAQGPFAQVARETFDVANHFHMFHSLAIVAIGILCSIYGSRLLLHVAGGAFLAGILLFSGGIYGSFGEPGQRPYIPIGGGLFMIGWVALAIGTFTLGKREA